MKKISWLMMAVCLVGQAFADAPDFVKSDAALWLDASTIEAAAGTQLNTWQDARGEGYLTATSYKDTKPQVIEIAEGPLAGKKAVTFFTAGTACDMQFTRVTGIKTVFFVVEMDPVQNAFWLGNTSTYNFHRGNNGSYWYNNSAADIRNTTYYNDGRVVANPTTDAVPSGYQLVTYQRGGSDTSNAEFLCNDRNIGGRIGGKRLCELIIFTRALGTVEQSIVEGYLKHKWYGGASAAACATEMLGKKAQVRFDASIASSFHYEVEGDDTGAKVSQWDDLSGNNNHFTPFHITADGPVYGTVTAIHTKPAYDSGAAGSRIDLQLTTRLTNTRTVVFVGDIVRNGNVFWLGDETNFRFHRNGNGEYAYAHSSNYLHTNGKIWKNGVRVGNINTEFPDRPGGPSVYVLQIAANCEWHYLGGDRKISGRNGGKQVCELLTFASDFSEADCAAMSKVFEEKWAPDVDTVLSEAELHVDAAKRENFNYSGNDISGWKNTGAGNDLTATVCYNRSAVVPGSWGYTNGVPAFLMGEVSSGIDMGYTRITDIQSVFWVMDIVRHNYAFFLGDMTTYHFHRGVNGQYSGNYAGMRDGDQYCDGVKVAAPLNDLPPYGTHVFNVVLAGNCASDRISRDRVCWDAATSQARDGGRALSELIIYRKPVSGLAMLAVQNHLKQKWENTSGWREDDGEWGAQKYRVFDADAAVPAEGAVAEGIGVNADATISGGTLTLGEGGVFAAKGVTATIAAPLASGSPIMAGGPGLVVLGNAPTASSIFVNRGSTLTLPLYGSVSGAVTLCEGAKLLLDCSNFTAGQYVALSFDSLSIPAGADLYDYVDVTDPEHNSLMLSADGKQLLVNEPGAPLTAEWVGNGDRANASDPANWVCYNTAGGVIDGALPMRATFVTIAGDQTFNLPVGQSIVCRKLSFGKVKLTADCDWRGLGAVDVSGGEIDLDGHKLYVSGMTGDGTITDFSAATSMKYFRLVIRKTYFGADTAMQLSEFALYAADGTRQNLNLASAGEAAANTLNPGTFSKGGAYTNSGTEGPEKLFDNNTGTKWCSTVNDMSNTYDNEAAWRIINLRLPADAKPIVAYNLYTANDAPCRQPSGWDLYASDNGTDWTLVDRRKGLARLGTYYQPLSASFPFANTTPGELHVVVAEGATFENTKVTLGGNLRLVKEGAGVFIASKVNQSYSGDTVVMAGTLKQGINGSSFPFGVSGANVVLEEGGTLDFNGKTGNANANIVGNGGVIANTVDGSDGSSAVGAINLNCDTTMNWPNNNGFGNGVSDLGGHTLTVNLGTAGKYLYIWNGAYDNDAHPFNELIFTNGTLKVASGGWFKIWSHFDCRTVNFDLNCAMYMSWRTDVKDLVWRYNGNYGTGPSGCFVVHGKFTPVGTHFFRTLLLNGGTLDLSGKEGVWSTKSALTANGTNYCTFEENATITIDAHGRKFKDGDQIVAWEEAAAPTNVKFVLDAASGGVGRKLKVEEDGVYYRASGLMIYVQ